MSKPKAHDRSRLHLLGGMAGAALTAQWALSPRAALAADKPLKVGFVYIGPVGDGGWTFAHDRGRLAMAEALGDKVETGFVESVPENADAARVFRDMAKQGYGLIFGTTFGYMESLVRVSKQFPKVRFEHATGFKSTANMRPYDVRGYQGAYLVGVIAGKMTKSNVLGFVASVPIPEVVRNINAFTLGAQSVNPNIKTRVVWVNKWFDPGKETEAAQALINGGADVLMQNTDSSAPLQAAEKAGVSGFGWDSDMTHYGPKAHLASAILNWAPYYTKAVKDVLEGTWKVEPHWWGVKEGAVDVVSFSERVPADVRALVAEKKQAMADGSLHVWEGPMTSNEGREVLAKGQRADDKFIGSIMFYVPGVEGKIPSNS